MKVNSGQAASTLIPEYIGSDFDAVRICADNIKYIKNAAGGTCEPPASEPPASGYIGDTPPTQPKAGSTWYCTLDGRSYIWYEDIDSGQWVDSSPQSGDAVPTDKMTLNAAATDAATATALVNQIRAGLIANGLAQ